MKNMKFKILSRDYLPSGSAVSLLLLFAFYLFLYSLPGKRFSEELLITDMIWLDAWGLASYMVLVVVWAAKMHWRLKARLLVAIFSVYGFITVCLILDGTPFGMNAYWGDQKFRQAMILKLIEFFPPVDFYYRDLPPFYPPVYYFLLSLVGRVFSLEAFRMIKAGTMLIYLVGPFLLYLMWRRIVSPFQAALI
ncbi:MAG: arabinofuranosyltransferase, partial [Candidatus Zixiibacteriota bacterium]